jgi:hypothetical protein
LALIEEKLSTPSETDKKPVTPVGRKRKRRGYSE